MPVLPDPAAGAISFQVLAEISAGATARIDLCRVTDARRPDLQGQLLAVKRLHPHVADDPGFSDLASLSQGQNDPTAQLEYLRGISDAEEVGTEQVALDEQLRAERLGAHEVAQQQAAHHEQPVAAADALAGRPRAPPPGRDGDARRHCRGTRGC